MKPKTFAMFSFALSIFSFYQSYQAFSTQHSVTDHGQVTTGQLNAVTKKTLGFIIPTGQTMKVSYQGIEQTFPVSKDVLAKYSNLETSQFVVNTPIPITYLPENPKVAMLAEMKGTQAYWLKEILLNLGVGIFLLFGAFLSFHKSQQNE